MVYVQFAIPSGQTDPPITRTKNMRELFNNFPFFTLIYSYFNYFSPLSLSLFYPPLSSNNNISYNIIFMILTYFLPILSMGWTYTRVGIKLWRSKTIGEYAPHQMENVTNKRRVNNKYYASKDKCLIAPDTQNK